MSRPLPRFTDHQLPTDPLETMLAQREAEIERARTKIAAGQWLAPDPVDIRGIPIQATGVGGTQPGTSPHGEAQAGHLDHRLRRRHAA